MAEPDLAALTAFATRYAKAWCSQDPKRVAECFAEDGSLRVNEGPVAAGREAIAKIAEGFMLGFPDLMVTMDKVVPGADGIAFHWTLTGTNTGTGGSGKRVRISGHELWQLNTDGLIARSQGTFDGKEFARQVLEGVDG
jgi:uncharacterized protein (TIGR02246 family)